MTASDLIDLFRPGEGTIVALAAVAAALATAVVWRALVFRDPLGTRLAGIEARRIALRQGLLAPRRRRSREAGLGTMRRVVDALNLLRSRQAGKATLQLSQAGFRTRDALVLYFFLKLVLPFVFGGVAAFALYAVDMGKLPPMARMAAALVAVGIGAWAPDIYLRNVAQKRQKALRKGVADTLDLLVICAEAGQSLDGALKRVAGEVGLFCPEMAEELALTAVELSLMPERRMALEGLARRTAIAEIRSVVNTLAQTEKYGTPLAQSLRVLGAEYRHDRLMRAEAKAARLPALLTVPLISFILPSLFIVLIGPAVLHIIDVFKTLRY